MPASRRIGILGAGLVWLSIGSLAAQSLEIRPTSGRVLLGDPVTFKITVVLRPGQELIDRVPRTLLPSPNGIDYLGGDTLRKSGEGRFEGAVRFQFFRLGTQPVPTLALLYRDAATQALDTLVPLPVPVTVSGLAPAGNPDLKDIRPLADVGPPAWLPIAILLVVVMLGALVIVRATRARSTTLAATAGALTSSGPFDRALAHLAALESGELGVVDLFDGMGRALREALLAAGVPNAATLTADELRSRLGDSGESIDAFERCLRLLGASDLVRFARVRPDRETARHHLSAARTLIQEWSRANGGQIHAVR